MTREMVLMSGILALAGVADRAAAGGRGKGVAEEWITVDVAAPSARRDRIAAWQWRYPGSPCAPAMT